MWLLSRLAPDFKTIADFRKDNGTAIKSVCREFVLLCKKLGLLSTACEALDGSKFKAVNNSDRAFSKAKIERRLKKLDESIEKYLNEITRIDGEDTKEANNTRIRLKDRLAKVNAETERLKLIEADLLKEPDQQISLTDPDARRWHCIKCMACLNNSGESESQISSKKNMAEAVKVFLI